MFVTSFMQKMEMFTDLISFGIVDLLFRYMVSFFTMGVGVQYLLFMSSLEALLRILAKVLRILPSHAVVCLIMCLVVEALRFLFFVFAA